MSLIAYFCNKNVRYVCLMGKPWHCWQNMTMVNTFGNKPCGRFLAVYLFSVALFYTLLGIQGFDMCDEGWVLSGFQQMFNDPESVQYLFLYYLSEYIGGLWYQLWNGCGIFGFRLLAMLVITVAAYLVYRMMSGFMPSWCIMAGMLWAFLCADYGMMVFYHNYLTAMLAVGASYALFIALSKGRPLLMALSGFIVGVNVFARLPNLSLVLLALAIVPYYRNNRDGRMALRMLLYAVAGFVAGIASMLTIMVVSGHLGVFVQAVGDGFSAVGDEKSTHNMADMFMTYVRNYKQVLTDMGLTVAFPAAIFLLRERAGRYAGWALYIAVGLVYALLVKGSSSNTFVLYAVSTAVCVWVMACKGFAMEMKYLSLIILVNMYALPLGSDFGIGNMGEYCVYMSGPFAVGVLYRQYAALPHGGRLRRLLLLCGVVLALFVLKRGVGNIAGQCYFDQGWRWEKTCLIDSPLATTYTTARNCRMLDPMLHELSRYVKKDDYLLCFQNIATVNYLTCTRPYLYNPWVWTYDPDNMKRKFDRAEAERKELPVIVRDKSMLSRWYEPYDDWNNDMAQDSYVHKNAKIRLINSFIGRHGYKVVWENDVFQILVPPSMQADGVAVDEGQADG